MAAAEPPDTGLDAARAVRLLGALPERPSFVAAEVATRMAERLGYVKLEPDRVVDAQSVPSGSLALLKARFPAARHIRLAARSRAVPGRWVRRLALREPETVVVAAAEALPLAAQCCTLVWSNLALHWHADAPRVMAEWHRVLRPGGLAMFTALGPDSLREVRAAFAGIDGCEHTLRFTDMHDFGDMLVEQSFAAPVMDMELLTLTYTERRAFWDEVRSLGGNAARARRRGLIGRAAARRLEEALDAQRGPDGRYRLTLEVIYGHAWKAEPRVSSDGRAIMRRIDRTL